MGEPPPHLSPAKRAAEPRAAFTTFVTATDALISTPLAGQERCVERRSGAVGLPAAPSEACSCWVRKPEMIDMPNGTFRATAYTLLASSVEIIQRLAVWQIWASVASGSMNSGRLNSRPVASCLGGQSTGPN